MSDEHTGGMVALIPRDDFAASLAVPGGDAADELHLTLAYLGDDVTEMDADDRVKVVAAAGSAAAQIAPLQARVMGHATFNPDGHDGREPCAVYLVGDSPVLSPLRSALVPFIEAEQHEPFLPHITGGYGVPASGLVYTGPVVFDRLRVAMADQYLDFPLGDSDEEIKALMDDLESKGTMPPGLAERFKKKGGKSGGDKGGTADAGINNIGDLAKAVKAYKAAKPDAKPELWKKIKAAATKLKAPKMLAGLSAPPPAKGNASEKALFDAVALEYKVTSEDPRAAKLRQWWAHDPKALALWKPGAPGDFKRLVGALRKHTPITSPEVLKGLAANIHHLALGAWPGQEGRKDAFDWLDLEVKVGALELESKAHGAELPDMVAQYKATRSALSGALDDPEDLLDGGADEASEADDNPGDNLPGGGEDEMSQEDVYADGLADDIQWHLEGDGGLEGPDDLDSPEQLGETSEEDDEDESVLNEVDDIFSLVDTRAPRG